MVVPIRPFEKRIYLKIPLEQIRVLNSRNRDRGGFEKNIRSIKDVGLLKPIVVNARYLKKRNYYDLVCGEGRYLAYKELNKHEIPAEVIDCTEKEALLYSLVENIARIPPGTMWFAKEIKRMRDSGLTLTQISAITGKCEGYLADYILLVEQGENRLIQGVEKEIFPISFALKVARAKSTDIQHILMDAFDSGLINSSNFTIVKKFVETRGHRSGVPMGQTHKPDVRPTKYSVKQLKADIHRVTKEKASFVNESTLKENRLLTLLDGLNTLWRDDDLVELMATNGIEPKLELEGNYNVQ